MNLLSCLLFAGAWALPSSQGPSNVQPLAPAISSIFPHGMPLTQQILQTFLQPLEVNLARNSFVTRQGTSLQLLGDHWTASGANVYWLGLDENVIPPPGAPFFPPLEASYPTHGRITEVMNVLVTMGATLIRGHTLGVSVGNPLSMMPDLGVVNEAAFDTIDWSVFQARQHGLRIMAPLTDNYDFYHGGKFTFLRWAGFNITGNDVPLSPDTLQFYTNNTIINDFKSYIRTLLTHVNPYTGLTYAEDPTIIGYETGNELGGLIFGDKDVPVAWTREICQFIKQLGPQKLCIDGTYGINTTHFAVEEIDIFSDHFYPPDIAKLNADVSAVESTNRVYLAGEVDWTGLNGGDDLVTFYETILARQNTTNPVVAGDLFWSLFEHNVPDCETFVQHNDGFTLQYGNPNNTAAVNARISIVRQHFFAMQNVVVDDYLPLVACPHNFVPGYDAQYIYV